MAVLGVIQYTRNSWTSTNDPNQENNHVQNAIQGIAERDSDRDGLQDREEQLWGEALTATDQLAKSIFSEYLHLKQSGVSLDAINTDQFVNSSLGDGTTANQARKYTLSDLKIIRNTGKEAVKRYGNEMGRIIGTHSVRADHELAILERALEENNPGELQKLDLVIAAYKKILEASLLVEVPEDFASTHLDLMNSFNDVANTIGSMKLVFNDPLRTLIGIRDYQKSAKLLYESLQGTKEYFQRKGIVFERDKEDGYIFTHILTLNL